MSVMNDPIADMLARIRNGQQAERVSVSMPSSRLKRALAQVLKQEGYISDYSVTEDEPQPELVVKLRYDQNKEPIIDTVERVSKPSRRVYAKARTIPDVLGGMGIAILSTSQGIMEGKKAREQNIGGEILCYVS